ncbi:MAG TPA: DUF2304 domain-containing protein [Candidatus Saccharimonadales bacterium]
MIFQLILVASAIVLAFVVLSRFGVQSRRALQKVTWLLLSLLIIVAVLFPGTVGYIANMLGIGRGADLVLYVFTISFIFFVLYAYIHNQKERDTLYRLSRQIALLEARQRYGKTKAKRR